MLDARSKLQCKDAISNLIGAAGGGAGVVAAITNGSEVPITISTVAAEEGYHNLDKNDYIKIGATVSKLYRSKYGKMPNKHSQFVGGAVREVNSYTSKDRELIVQALAELAK